MSNWLNHTKKDIKSKEKIPTVFMLASGKCHTYVKYRFLEEADFQKKPSGIQDKFHFIDGNGTIRIWWYLRDERHPPWAEYQGVMTLLKLHCWHHHDWWCPLPFLEHLLLWVREWWSEGYKFTEIWEKMHRN